MPEHRQRSAAALLALAYGALVLYASLYPFESWRWPPGQTLWALLVLPRSVYHVAFDVASNLAGYVPLGALLTLALRRPGVGARSAWLQAVLLCGGLSYCCETLQQLVPARVPALEDLALNAAGGALGALVGLALHAAGVVARWHAMRLRWFASDGAMALALLVMWPVGLLFPAPVPLGLGQVGERLREWLADTLNDVPWAQATHALLAAPPPPPVALSPLAEVAIVAAGLLAPCLVAYSVVAPGWRRGVMALGALLLGTAGMTMSTMLNFGPNHALAWLTDVSLPGLGLGLLGALLLVPLPQRVATGVGLVVLTGLVLGVAQAPADPYFAQSLQAWEQGRFVRFHGLAQWVGWLWPYVAIGWLLARLGARH